MRILGKVALFGLAILLIAMFLGYQGFGLRVNSAVNRCLGSGQPLAKCDCLGAELRAEIGLLRGSAMWSEPLSALMNVDREAAISEAVPVARARCDRETI